MWASEGALADHVAAFAVATHHEFVAAAMCSVLVALLHVYVIAKGPWAYRFFGAVMVEGGCRTMSFLGVGTPTS